MATYNKFNAFVTKVNSGSINLNSDSLYLLLTDASPNSSDTAVNTTTATCTVISSSNAAEIASQNGYTKKGALLTFTTSNPSGTYTLSANQVVWTASGGTIGPFRYPVLFDYTVAASNNAPAIAWWDYGSDLTLNSGDTFTVQFNGSNPGTVYTMV